MRLRLVAVSWRSSLTGGDGYAEPDDAVLAVFDEDDSSSSLDIT